MINKLINDMKTDMWVMHEKVEKLKEIILRQEEYLRRNCLLLHDIAEIKGEMNY